MWARLRGAILTRPSPAVIHDKRIGPPLDILAEHVLAPAEYDDDLDTLIARYPVPPGSYWLDQKP